MDVATTFLPLLQVFAAKMTRPTFRTFATLLTGWLLTPHRTIIGMVRASGDERHHAAFHRLFANAKWSIDQVGLAVFDLVTAGMKVVYLVGDDTLIPRTSLKVFGTGMHRDPMLSSRSFHVTRWGHCWVVQCVIIESRWTPGRVFALPVLGRLYLNKTSAAKWKRVYRKKTDLMLDMLLQLDRHVQSTEKSLHFVGDSAYTASAVLNRIPASIAVTGRVVFNSRMYDPPPVRDPNRPGRPRKRGERLPAPIDLLATNRLRRLTMQLYNGQAYKMRVTQQVGRFHKAPERDVKVVVADHLRGGRGVETFYSTEVSMTIETILRTYSRRWSVEVTFQNTKQHLGVAEPRNRKPLAVRRTAATGFLLYSLIIWWHEHIRSQPASFIKTWPGKTGCSFADIMASLRNETLSTMQQNHLSTPAQSPGVMKYIQHLTRLLTLAA
jgi:hypothetical protein